MSDLNSPLILEEDEEKNNIGLDTDVLKNIQEQSDKINLDLARININKPYEAPINNEVDSVETNENDSSFLEKFGEFHIDLGKDLIEDPIGTVKERTTQLVDKTKEEVVEYKNMVGSAWKLNSPISWAYNSNFFNTFDVEKDFNIDPETIVNLRRQYGEKVAVDILNSNSAEEFDFRLDRAERYMENIKTLKLNEGFGIKNISAMIHGVGIDPTTWAMVYATRGAYIPKLTSNMTNAARIAAYAKRGTVVGATEGTGYGLVHNTLNPYTDLTDNLEWWTAFGAAGGLIGNSIIARINRNADLKRMNDMKMPVPLKQAREGEDFWSSVERTAHKNLWDDAEDLIQGNDGVWYVPEKDWQTSKIIPYKKQDIKPPKGWIDNTTPLINLEKYSPVYLKTLNNENLFNIVHNAYGINIAKLGTGTTPLTQNKQLTSKIDGRSYTSKEFTEAGRKIALKTIEKLWQNKQEKEIEALLAFKTINKQIQEIQAASSNNRYEKTRLIKFRNSLQETVWTKEKGDPFANFNLKAYQNAIYKSEMSKVLENKRIDGKDYLIKRTYQHPNTKQTMFAASDGNTQQYYTLVKGSGITKGQDKAVIFNKETGEIIETISPRNLIKLQAENKFKGSNYYFINKDGLRTGWYTSDPKGSLGKHLTDDTTLNGDGRLDAIRASYNHRAMTEAQEAEMVGGEALTNLQKTIKNSEKLWKKLDARNLPFVKDLQNVPVARYQKWSGGLTKIISAVARASQSESPEIRALALRLGTVTSRLENQAGQNVPIGQNATLLFQGLERAAQVRWGRTLLEHGIHYRKGGHNFSIEQLNIATFHHLTKTPMPSDIPPLNSKIIELIEARGKLLEEIFDGAVKDGVVGLPQKIPNYGMPRQYIYDKSFIVFNKFDVKDLQLTFGKMVYRELTKDLPPEKVTALLQTAKGKEAQQLAYKAGATYLKSIHRKIIKQDYEPSFNSAAMSSKVLGGEDDLIDLLSTIGRTTDDFGKEIIDESLALSPQQINSVIDKLPINKTNAGKSRNIHARQRMKIDDKGIYNVKLKTGGVAPFTLSDMLDTNAEQLVQPYIYRMSGARALARVGIDTDESFESLRTEALNAASSRGLDPKIVQKEIAALDYMYKMIRGSFDARGHLGQSAANLGRRFKAVSFIYQMAKAGAMAMIEGGAVASENGVRTFLKNSLLVPDMIRRAKSGKLNDNVLAFLEDLDGRGGDLVTGRFQSRYMENTVQDIIEHRMNKFDKIAEYWQRVTSIWGGLAPVTTLYTRYHSRNTVQRFYDNLVKPTLVIGGKPNLNFYGSIKFQQLGLTEDMLLRIAAQMKKHTFLYSKKEGVRGKLGLVKTFNTSIWDDQVAADAMNYALLNDIRNTIQTTNPSNLNSFIKSEVGTFSTQFLSFSAGAQSQQLERYAARISGEYIKGKKQRDLTAIRTVASMFAIAGAITIGKIYHASLGRSDQEEYLEKHLTVANVASRAMLSTGTTGLFSAVNWMKPEEAFTNLITPPTANYVHSLSKGATDLLSVPFGESLSESEARSIMNVIIPPYLFTQPFTNMAADAITED